MVSKLNFDIDVAVVGAGRVGLPWAAVLAEKGLDVVCIDTDARRVEKINNAVAPFKEPGLQQQLTASVEAGRLRATTQSAAVSRAGVVTICLNCPVDGMETFLKTTVQYAEKMTSSQVLLSRTTLPIETVEKLETMLLDQLGSDRPHFGIFPERLAEGSAISDIERIPKIVGRNSDYCQGVVELLLEDFEAETLFTDPRTAMFVKLIDNTYRATRFALANYYAIVGDGYGIDVHEAIKIANHDFDKTNVPSVGTVGGKCLLKDTEFLSDSHINPAVNVPDFFAAVNRIHQGFERLVVQRVVDADPDHVALLGTAYKRDADSEAGSPAVRIKNSLEERGLSVTPYDPHVPYRETFSSSELATADIVVIAVDHSKYKKQWKTIQDCANGPIIDIWGIGGSEEQIKRIGARG